MKQLILNSIKTVLFCLLCFSCDRELDFGVDYQYSFDANVINSQNSASISSNIPIKIVLNNIGMSSNIFKLKYTSSGFGDLIIQSSNNAVPINEYFDVTEGELLLNFTSTVVGSQVLNFQAIDLAGNVKTVEIELSFNEPDYQFIQDTDFFNSSGNNAIHDVYIDNEDISNDSYELKYEFISLNFTQEPGTTEIAPTVIIGDNNLVPEVTLQTNQLFSDITNSLITVGSKKKIIIRVVKGGYSQFQMKITVKNSFNIEKTLIINHSGFLPEFNYTNFLTKYKKSTWVPLGGSNVLNVYFSVCISAPSVTGATLQSVKILSRNNTEQNYTVRYSGSMPSGNSYSYSKSFTQQSQADNCFDIVRVLLTYSNGTIYWVDRGTNYDIISPYYYGSGFNLNPCN